MTQAFIIEAKDGTGENSRWVQIGIFVGASEEFQDLYGRTLDRVSKEFASLTRWRRLMSMIELQAYSDAGVQIRSRDIVSPIDWN